MANLNRVLLIGRLTRDPELRYTATGTPVADFGLAVNRFRKNPDGTTQEETTFVDITTWSRTAELASQYLGKGRQVFVEGRLKFDQWTSPEGQKRSKLTVVADNLQFLDAKGSAPEGAGGQGPGGSAPRGRAPAGRQGYSNVPEEFDAGPSYGEPDFGGPAGGGPTSGDDAPF